MLSEDARIDASILGVSSSDAYSAVEQQFKSERDPRIAAKLAAEAREAQRLQDLQSDTRWHPMRFPNAGEDSLYIAVANNCLYEKQQLALRPEHAPDHKPAPRKPIQRTSAATQQSRPAPAATRVAPAASNITRSAPAASNITREQLAAQPRSPAETIARFRKLGIVTGNATSLTAGEWLRCWQQYEQIERAAAERADLRLHLERQTRVANITRA